MQEGCCRSAARLLHCLLQVSSTMQAGQTMVYWITDETSKGESRSTEKSEIRTWSMPWIQPCGLSDTSDAGLLYSQGEPTPSSW